MNIDVFNGDADGICALHQWRLAYPESTRLVTGVKRKIDLLSGLEAEPGDSISVFDISLEPNRKDAERLLAKEVSIRWFDHHNPGEGTFPFGLEACIDTAADTCTSLIVDRALGGRYTRWTVAAAFGDNLHKSARAAAGRLHLEESEIRALTELGELINYNGYGDTIEDLLIAPDALYRELAHFENPADFIASSAVFRSLREGFAADIESAAALPPCLENDHAAAYVLPDLPWARRVIGSMANRLATANPQRAHALLVPNQSGCLTVSVRAPVSRPQGADVVCRGFPTGGGRSAAAGINHLPVGQINEFLAALDAAFGTV